MTCMDSFETRNETRLDMASGRSAHWLVLVIYTTSGLAFVLDLYGDNSLAYGITYMPLIATGVFQKRRAGLWVLSTIACLMVLAGALRPLSDPQPTLLLGNRILAILAIATTAAFIHHARDTQDRLVSETRRAEAAERIKSEVLSSLSQQIRTPFHALLGVLSLMIATSRPDQKEALRKVRGDGKNLLATIENLLDLTQVGDHRLQRQTIDFGSIARDAAENARASASERQISIAMNQGQETGNAAAIGDPWAMRRILDNLLDNAVRLTPPGGVVSVWVARDADMVTASISDTGNGLPPALTQDFHLGGVATANGGLPALGCMGLALSDRLARAMNGRLTAFNQPSRGATVSLSLPAA